tara:strand:- start:1081 stop:2094 length:1014 start_codon:yes stop_codon:yes gene_type:complete
MIQEEQIFSITRDLVYENFYNYFLNKEFDKTNHVILDRFFPDERRTTSIMAGLQTSLGSYWEKLAKKFASLNGFEIIENSALKKPSFEDKSWSELITNTKEFRETKGGDLSKFKEELNKLYNPSLTDKHLTKLTKGKGSDLILSKDDQIFIFDIKTVQINANNGNLFNESLILWTAYWKYIHGIDANKINAKLIIPYNSSNENDDDSWWNDFGDRVSPCCMEDLLIGSHFWRFISGNKDALNIMIKAFNYVSNDSRFIKIYKQSFALKEENEIELFKKKIKLNRISQVKNVIYHSDNELFSMRKKLKWKHGECVFCERFNKLLNDQNYECPTCGQKL